MIITFVGHSSLYNYEKNLIENVKNVILENIEPDDDTKFFCGGYGDFDNLCTEVCHLVKEYKYNCELVFISPYFTKSYQEKLKYLVESKTYDSTIYPPLEKVPAKYAIIKRNEWMVDSADLVIAYVNCEYGGAYRTLQYARRKKKRVINLADVNGKQ